MFFEKRKSKEDDNKRYILNVISKHQEGEYSSHWHGWSSKWLFTYDEANKEKTKIQHLYHEVEVVEFTA